MIRIMTLALSAGLLAAPLADAAAQERARDTTRARIHADARRPGAPAMRARPIERLIAQRERLKLTDDQVARLNAIQSKYAELNRPHVDALKAARSDTAGRPRPARPAERPKTAEERLERRQQMLDRQKAFLAAHPEVSRAHTALAENATKAHEEVQAVLTEEQKTLLKQQMEHRRGERRDRMRAPGRPGVRRDA